MARDRLPSLNGSESSGFPEFPQEDREIEWVDSILAKVSRLHQRIASIENNVERIKEKHHEMLREPDRRERTKQELSELSSDLQSEANAVRVSIHEMKKELNATEEEGNLLKVYSAKHRMLKLQCNTLSKKFVDVMNIYNECQVMYRQKCKERIQRQLAIAGRTTTDEELEDMLESDLQIFFSGIDMETTTAKKALADVTARHEDIMRLENDVREMHQLFQDLALIVEYQGGVVDLIAANVNNSLDYVEDGVVEIINTTQIVKKRRKRKRRCCVFVVILLIVLIIIVLAITLNI